VNQRSEREDVEEVLDRMDVLPALQQMWKRPGTVAETGGWEPVRVV